MEGGLRLSLVAHALLLLAFAINVVQGGQGVGAAYAMQGNNFPPPGDVVNLCKSRNIYMLRLYGPGPDFLAALRNSGISIMLDVIEADLQQLGTNYNAAIGWVKSNILPYVGAINFQYIVMGNEEILGNSAGYILPAINNVVGALKTFGQSIPVTTAVSTNVIGITYPPSKGAFSNKALQVLKPILSALASRNTPLMVNLYPYFTYASNPGTQLGYALFTATSVMFRDENFVYTNLFDAMLDTVRSALTNAGTPGVDVVVSETGWPSAGANGATVENARLYANNLVKHIHSGVGTPMHPGKRTDVYLYSLFQQNLKPAGIEQNFGIFNTDKSEVYHVDF